MRALLRLDAARRRSRTSPPSARSTGPARWAPTRTTTTPTARTAASRSTPIHPELAEPLAEILDETYGLLVYQEQVLAIAQKVAGYSLGQADLLRKAMGKKKKEILDKEYVAVQRRHAERTATAPGAIKTLWDTLVPFSDYAFNKAHSAGYGVVSYWTAYLKANYPAEYMAALLTCVSDDKDKSRALPQRVPADGHQGAAARRQRVRRQLHPARHRHPVRPLRDPQRRRQRRRLDRRDPRGTRAASPTSPTSSPRSTPVVCNKRPSSR